jgi:hypothetical protein
MIPEHEHPQAAVREPSPESRLERTFSVNDTRNQVLTGAVNRALEGSGLQVTCTDSEMTITDPRQPEKGPFILDFKCRYIARECREYDYWHFDHLTDDQAAVFIAAKIREILGEHVRLASETEARVELARREELSARVMSGELDDVNLYVRRD